MNWTALGSAAIAALFIWLTYRNRNGIKSMMERSKAAPQYWGSYALLMIAIILLVYILIKL